VELHRCDNSSGGDVFVAGPVVDILLRKWIPLEDRPDNITLEPVEEEEEKEVEAEMENSHKTLHELFMREKCAPPTINASPLFSRRSQRLQSKSKSVRPRTTDASPVFVRRSPQFQSQSKPVSLSREVADKELPGRKRPRTHSPSRRSPARPDRQLTPPMEQDVNMELEMQQSADPVVPTVRTTRPVQTQHIVEPESLEQPVQSTGIPEPHPSSIRTPGSPQLNAHRQSGLESQDTFQTSPEVVPVSKPSHFPSVLDTTEGSLNEQDVNIKNLMSFFQQAAMYVETCQWVLAKMSNLQLGKQKLEQANKTLKDALNLKAAELQELHNSNNAKDQQIKELQAEVKSNQQVQEDLQLKNHEFNKLSINLESL
jgi:hypothetical protein